MTSAPRLETITPWRLCRRGIVVVGQPTAGDARRRGGSIKMRHGTSGDEPPMMQPVREWRSPKLPKSHDVLTWFVRVTPCDIGVVSSPSHRHPRLESGHVSRR